MRTDRSARKIKNQYNSYEGTFFPSTQIVSYLFLLPLSSSYYESSPDLLPINNPSPHKPTLPNNLLRFDRDDDKSFLKLYIRLFFLVVLPVFCRYFYKFIMVDWLFLMLVCFIQTYAFYWSLTGGFKIIDEQL